MPEFVMPLGENGIRTFNNLPSFVQGYIEAMFFTECIEDLEDARFDDLAVETLAEIISDCDKFMALQGPLIKSEPGDDAQAGRDFWFTRNGHGTGFLDRDDSVWSPKARQILTATADAFGEVQLYRDNDGMLYLEED